MNKFTLTEAIERARQVRAMPNVLYDGPWLKGIVLALLEHVEPAAPQLKPEPAGAVVGEPTATNGLTESAALWVNAGPRTVMLGRATLLVEKDARLAYSLRNSAPAIIALVNAAHVLMRYPELSAYVGSQIFNPVKDALDALGEDWK